MKRHIYRQAKNLKNCFYINTLKEGCSLNSVLLIRCKLEQKALIKAVNYSSFKIESKTACFS
jgi:hypothetical protein